MKIPHMYMLSWAKKVHAQKKDAKILDYGCGLGEIVLEARNLEINAFGADLFYLGSSQKETLIENGLLGNLIFEIEDGRLPFDDEYFDLVVSNQVFEHVYNIDPVIKEIHRTMTKTGIFISHFPSSGVIREGHIGIPLVHWFKRKSKVRYYYTLLLRTMGFGYYKGDMSRSEWVKKRLKWIDNYTVYRDKRTIIDLFERYFKLTMIEDDYIKFRCSLKNSTKWLPPLLKIPLFMKAARVIFYMLAGLVILAKKK